MANKGTHSKGAAGAPKAAQKGSRKVSGKKVVAAALGVAAATTAGVVAFNKTRSNRTVLRVKPNGERWDLQIGGNRQPTKTFDAKKEALAAARETAHRSIPSELIIHRADGSEQDRHRYEA